MYDDSGQLLVELLGVKYKYLDNGSNHELLDGEPSASLRISASFTAEPLKPALRFWTDELEAPHDVEFAPYNQVFQQLLDPGSLLRTNRRGANIILLRLEDWSSDHTP